VNRRGRDSKLAAEFDGLEIAPDVTITDATNSFGFEITVHDVKRFGVRKRRTQKRQTEG
jgi:hypothetical protein